MTHKTHPSQPPNNLERAADQPLSADQNPSLDGHDTLLPSQTTATRANDVVTTAEKIAKLEENDQLPILAFKEQIIESIQSSPVTIITAETGAGKTTQVPQYLAEQGYRVVVTQPRRLAARTVAARVAHEMREKLGRKVGYRTANDHCDSPNTEVLFCTDGLQLVRELTGHGQSGDKTVLVLDEVHEWNTNMEVLVAWAKKRIAAGENLKVVLMSATLDAQKLAQFFDGENPAISVPGRLYPVEKKHASAQQLFTETQKLAAEGRNVLVFQPGKKEIAETVANLQKVVGSSTTVLPLHGQLTPAEQKECFIPPSPGCNKIIVATNVAQTSVTIPYIDAVVDSGLERRIELVDGIEGLYLKNTSQADCKQRAGRAGRCRPGVYVLCSDAPEDRREPFPKAEILRSRLDQVVLRLAAQGFDAEDLDFFHQPSKQTIAEAKRALKILGAMDKHGNVTKVGRDISRLPLSVQYGRMLIEAQKNHVVDEVATIVACMEAGDIRARGNRDNPRPWQALTSEKESDLLVLLDLYNAARNIKGGKGLSKSKALREAGIFAKDYFRADEIRRKVIQSTRGKLASSKKRKRFSNEDIRKRVLKSCAAGMVDHLYRKGYSGYRNGDDVERALGFESVVQQPEWIVGLPKDIEIRTRYGLRTLNLIHMATKVDPQLLEEVAPQLVETKNGLSPRFDRALDSVVVTNEIYFNGQKVRSEVVPTPEHENAAEIFASFIAHTHDTMVGTPLESVKAQNLDILKRMSDLNIRAREEVFSLDVLAHYRDALDGARCIAEVKNTKTLEFPQLNQENVDAILKENPDTITVLGEELSVSYSEYRAPSVEIPNLLGNDEWKNLPDEGLFLPSGQEVLVRSTIGYGNGYLATPSLKKKMAQREHENMYSNWTDYPDLHFPSLDDLDAQIPDIVACEVGKHVLDGSPLMIYGTMRIRRLDYYGKSLKFEAVWTKDRVIAEQERESTMIKLSEILKKKRAELMALEQQRQQAAEEARLREEKILREKQEKEAVKAAFEKPVERHSVSIEATTAALQGNQLAQALQAKLAAGQLKVTEIDSTLQERKYDISRDLLRVSIGLAEAAKTDLGKNAAIALFERELDANYGRARRQKSILSRLDSVANREIEQFSSLGRARDVNDVLRVAALHLRESMESSGSSSPTDIKKIVPTTNSTDTKVAAERLKPAKLQNTDLSKLFGGSVSSVKKRSKKGRHK